MVRISFKVDVLGNTVLTADMPVTPPVATALTNKYSTTPADGVVEDVNEIPVATPSQTVLVVGDATSLGLGSTVTITLTGVPVQPLPPRAPFATGVIA